MDAHAHLLAESPCARITRCKSGHFHVSVGPVTVRMEPEIFRAFVLTVRDAAEHLTAPPPSLPH